MEGIGQIKKNSDRSSTPFGVDVFIFVHYPQVIPVVTIVSLLRSNCKIIREYLNHSQIFMKSVFIPVSKNVFQNEQLCCLRP